MATVLSKNLNPTLLNINIVRIGTIVYTLSIGGTISDSTYYTNDKKLDVFFYLEMPFDFIVCASIV